MPTKNEMAATMTRADAVRSGIQTFDGDAPRSILGTTTNSRKLFGFTRKMLPTNMPTEPKVYIYSISVYGDVVDLGPGFPKFTVKPCPEGAEYGDPCVVDALYFQEEAQVDKTEFNPHTGHQLAEAILRVGPGMAAAWDRRRNGWFMSAHNPPLPEEVKRAQDIYNQECMRLVKEGNSFASSGKLTEINETHHRAASCTKQKVDWDKAVSKMVECAACGEPIKAGAIIHAVGYCGAVQPGRWPEAILHGIKKIEDAPHSVQVELGHVEAPSEVLQPEPDMSFENPNQFRTKPKK